MALICPNKNSVEWESLTASVGETEAYRLFNILNDIPEFWFKETKNVLDFVENNIPRISKIKKGKYKLPSTAPAGLLNRARIKVKEINDLYPGLISSKMETIGTRRSQTFVINENIVENYIRFGQEADKQFDQRQKQGNWRVDENGDIKPYSPTIFKEKGFKVVNDPEIAHYYGFVKDKSKVKEIRDSIYNSKEFPTPDIVEEYKEKSLGKTNSKQILELLAKSAKEKRTRKIAKWLLTVVEKNNAVLRRVDTNVQPEFIERDEDGNEKKWYMYYDQPSNEIRINVLFTDRQAFFEESLVHEIIHSLTVSALDNVVGNSVLASDTDIAFYEEMEAVRKEILSRLAESYGVEASSLEELSKKIDDKNFKERDFYGLTDVREFVAELMINKNFFKAIKNLDTDNNGFIRKILEAFVRWITGNSHIKTKINPENLQNLIKSYISDYYDFMPDLGNYNLQSEDPFSGPAFTQQKETDLNSKLDYLQNKLPNIKEVIYDSDIEGDSQLTNNGTKLVVNPETMSNPVGHDVGHIIIDALGGLNNPLIKRGRELLIDSDFESAVLKDTEGLDPAKQDKEVLSIAIAKHFEEVFPEQGSEERNNWSKWLVRFFRKTNIVFGTDHSDIRKEFGLIVKNKTFSTKPNGFVSVEDDLMGETLDGKETISKEVADLKMKELSRIEEILEEAIRIQEKKIEILVKSGKYTEISDKLKNTLESMKELDPKQAMVTFSRQSYNNISFIYNQYQEALEKEKEGESPFTQKMLLKWKDFLSAYDSALDNFQSYLSENPEEQEILVEDPKTNEKVKISLIPMVDEAIKRKNIVKNAFITKGLELTTKFLSQHYTRFQSELREELRKKYASLSKEERKNIPFEEYAAKEIKLSEEDIKYQTETLMRAELKKASEDVNYLTRWLDNMLDTPDVAISAMVRAMVIQSEKSRLDGLKKRDEIVVALRKLEKVIPNNLTTSTKSFYSMFLEQIDGKYTQYFVTQFRTDMWEEWNKQKKKTESLLEEGKIDYSEYLDMRNSWKEDNAPLNKTNYKEVYEKEIDRLANEHSLPEDIVIKLKDNLFPQTSLKKQIGEKYSFIVDEVNRWKRFNEWKHRSPIKKWENKQFKKLEEIRKSNPEDPIIKFYDLMLDTIYKQANKLLPYNLRLEYGKLPSITADTAESIKNGMKANKAIKRAIQRGVVLRADEIERGSLSKLTDEQDREKFFLPVFYTTEIEESEQSYDLATLAMSFYQMASDYNYKSEILPQMEMAKEFITTRQVVQNVGGNSLQKLGSNLKQKELVKSGQNSMLTAQLEDYYKGMMFSQWEEDQGALFQGLGITTKIDKGKFFNLIGKYTALNMLGLNFAQGFANATLGQVVQHIESFAGEFYSYKDLAKAGLEYDKQFFGAGEGPGILEDIGSRKPSNKINLLNELFDTLNEYEGGKLRKGTRFRQLMMSNTLFFTSHIGEHYMQSRVMLAMLMNTSALDKNGKALKNEDGSTMNLYQAFEVKDETLKLKDEVKFNEEDIILFGQKVKRILSRMHGEYGRYGKIAFQRTGEGRLVYMFRKFIVPGVKRRYGKKNYNNLLQEYTEGNVRTTAKFFLKMVKDIQHFKQYVGGSQWDSLSRHEKANIRRTIYGLTSWAVATVLFTALTKLDGDDDDDSLFEHHTSYQLRRLMAELSFFSNPTEAMRILRSPAAAMSTLESLSRFLAESIPPYEVYERGSWKGKTKLSKAAVRASIGIKQFYRLKNIEDQLKMFGMK